MTNNIFGEKLFKQLSDPNYIPVNFIHQRIIVNKEMKMLDLVEIKKENKQEMTIVSYCHPLFDEDTSLLDKIRLMSLRKTGENKILHWFEWVKEEKNEINDGIFNCVYGLIFSFDKENKLDIMSRNTICQEYLQQISIESLIYVLFADNFVYFDFIMPDQDRFIPGRNLKKIDS